MAKQNPIPQNPIGESFVWRDWFQRLSDKVFGSAAAIDVPIQPEYGGTGITTYNKGDIIYSNATNNLTRLAAPASTSVLQMTALGVPSWTTASTGTVTSVSGTGTVNGLTLTGTVTTSGNLTLGGTLDLSSPPAIGGTTPAAGTFTTLTATGQTSLGGAAGSESLRVVTQASAVNRATIKGGTSGSPVAFGADNGGTGTVLNVYNSNGLPILFTTNGFYNGGQLQVSHTASAVNYVQVTGAATGNTPAISSQGSDANINLLVNPKGTGSFAVFANSGTQFRVSSVASAVNNLNATGSVTGLSPTLASQGSDTNISQVFQSKGTGAIDLAAGSRGVNISNGGTVTALTFTAAGNAYTSFPSIAITAPTTAGGVQATATLSRLFQNSATVAGGGTGYTVGNTLTVVGGTPVGSAATLTVSSVSGGVITAVASANFAQYTALPTNPVSVTGGTGSGATLNLQWSVLTGAGSYTITNAGSGYVEQPTVSFSGGGGSGAAAYATVGSGTVVRSIGSNIGFHTPAGLQLLVNDGGGTGANYWRFSGSGTNAGVQVLANGSDTNIGALYSTKGTGGHSFYTNNFAQTQFQVAHTASAVNYVQVTGAATGGAAKVSSQGSDTNVGLALSMKGWQNISFYSGNFGYEIFRNAQATSTPANFISTMAVAAGSAPYIAPLGSDTNIDLALIPKGTGQVVVGGSNGIRVSRVNSSDEGGQLDLCRSSDNVAAWGVDVFGSTSTPSLRFVDNTAGATRMTIDGSGNTLVQVQTSAPSLASNNQMVFNLTSDTNLRISVRGSDGVTRTTNLTLS